MRVVAQQALGNSLTDEEKDSGMCFPSVKRVREVTVNVAAAGNLVASFLFRVIAMIVGLFVT
jgi:hypothetical protein